MENQMEKKMENEMDTVKSDYGYVFPTHVAFNSRRETDDFVCC